MPYTTYSMAPAGGDASDHDPNGVIYPEDITVLMAQPDAVGVISYKAAVGARQLKLWCMIAVKNVNGNIVRLDDANNLVALPCPRFDHPGGHFIPNP